MARSSRVRQPFSASSESFRSKPKGGGRAATVAESKAAGYAKRHAAKKSTDTKAEKDVYEYTQSSGKGKRRANVTLELDHGEDLGDDAEAREELRARLLGSDEEVDSGDDEDLDSDAAFESEDEERYAGFFGKGYKSEEESEEESEDGEFIDVLDVLDGRGDDQPNAAKDDSGSEDEDGDLDALTSFVSSLPTAPKRKPEDAPAPDPKRRRVLKEQPAGPENPFFAASSSSSTKLQLDDLLDLSLPKFKPTAAPLSAPLQLRAQERVDREAAYTATKAEVDKWSAVMRRVQDAEYLSFPLQPAAPEAATSTAALSASFAPRTELESSVDALLRKGGLRDEDVSRTEEVLGRGEGLTVDEVRERRRELRERRELMFRAEKKMKRVKRIKSKLYRRHHRKAGEEEDEEGEGEDGDKARAMERATLRHKNTAKLARAAHYEDDEGEGSRKQIEEMLERGERSRRKIRGDADDEEEEQDPYEELQQLRGEEEEEVEGKGVLGIKFMQDAMKRREKAAQDEVEGLNRELDGAPVVERTGGGGRMVFRPETSKAVDAFNKTPETSAKAPETSTKAPDTSNPWLASSASAPVKKSTKPKVVVDKNSRSSDKAAYKLSKSKPAQEEEEEMEIDGELMQGDSTKAFRQRHLVKQAFAGDDVVREFAERKQAEVDGDKPKVIDTTLPGWGAWSGPGVTAPAKPNPKYAKHVKGIAPEARSDAGKAHVIISQRVDKKFVERYTVRDLPYPYTSKAQYEGRMAGAVGREWNTRVGFQRGTRGRVVKKMGQVIEPLEKMHS